MNLSNEECAMEDGIIILGLFVFFGICYGLMRFIDSLSRSE